MFTRILLAVDGTESGDVAVSFVVPLARQFSGAVRVVYVNELLVGGRGFTVSTDKEAKRIVDDAVAQLWMAGIDADGVVLRGNCFSVDARIVDAAHEWAADVIALGSHRRRWLRRLSGKGMRERVTAATGLPTLTAPAPLGVSARYRHEQIEFPTGPLAEAPTVTN